MRYGFEVAYRGRPQLWSQRILEMLDLAVANEQAEFRRRRDVIVSGLRKIPGFTCPQPRGAFFAGTFGRSDESLPHSRADSFGTMMCLTPYRGPREEDPRRHERGGPRTSDPTSLAPPWRL